jgi:hypothetical protein
MDEQPPSWIAFPNIGDHSASKPQCFAGLLKPRVFAKARQQILHTGMERVSIQDFRRPTLEQRWEGGLLHRSPICLGVSLRDGGDLFAIRGILE